MNALINIVLVVLLCTGLGHAASWVWRYFDNAPPTPVEEDNEDYYYK